MKLKQIMPLLVVPLYMVSALMVALAQPASPAAALTTAEKKACYEKWAGRANGSAGDGKSFNESSFNKDKCSTKKNGTCKVVRYEDGAVIHCKNAEGKYDNGDDGWKPAEDGDGSGGVLQDPVAGNDCGGVKTAIIKCDQNNSGSNVESNGIWGLLLIAINIMTAGVGVLAVGGIVYGAILYTTAEDKADQVKKAIDIITNVVIGLVAFALMWAGLNFLIPGGVFS